ncbi:hypothetical protein ACJX0J_028304 [Zea mays]
MNRAKHYHWRENIIIINSSSVVLLKFGAFLWLIFGWKTIQHLILCFKQIGVNCFGFSWLNLNFSPLVYGSCTKFLKIAESEFLYFHPTLKGMFCEQIFFGLFDVAVG